MNLVFLHGTGAVISAVSIICHTAWPGLNQGDDYPQPGQPIFSDPIRYPLFE